MPEEAITSTLTPEQKAAAVIVSLGSDNASKIYKYLDESDIEKLTVEVAKLGHLPADATQAALDDFYKMCLTQKVVTDGGLDYARTVLEKAFGESTATALLEKVSKSLKQRAFGFIRKNDTKNLLSVLTHERAQTIALVLSYIESEQAAAVIAELPEAKRLGVVECIAQMDSASPEAIKIVEKELQRKFSAVLTTDYTQVGGIDYIADVMNHMDRSNEKMIFDELSKKNGELAEDIRKRMFVFEDIAGLDKRAIQAFIRECDMKDLLYALKGATPQMSELIFANMSSRMAESVRSDLEITTNVRLKDVEEAQQRIVNVIRSLEERGEIVISKGGKDEIIA